MAKKGFKCSKCDRSFSMAAHLARHMSTIHASPKKKAAAKRSRKAKKVWRARKIKRKTAGRPKRAARTGLSNMSMDQLINLLAAVRGEMRRRIAEIRKTVE